MPDVFSQADKVLDDLREAMRTAGIILPSTSIDLASTMAGQPLIDLGRVNLATAAKLARAIQTASDTEQLATAEHRARA